jgi:hypothetical protein
MVWPPPFSAFRFLELGARRQRVPPAQRVILVMVKADFGLRICPAFLVAVFYLIDHPGHLPSSRNVRMSLTLQTVTPGVSRKGGGNFPLATHDHRADFLMGKIGGMPSLALPSNCLILTYPSWGSAFSMMPPADPARAV